MAIKDDIGYWDEYISEKAREAGRKEPNALKKADAIRKAVRDGYREAAAYADETGNAELAKDIRHSDAETRKGQNLADESGIFGDEEEADAKNAAIDAKLKADDYQADIEELGEEHFFIDPEDVEKFETGDPLEIERVLDKLPMEDLEKIKGILGESRFEDFMVPGEGRDAQIGALERFQEISEGGPDAVAEAEYQRRRGSALQGQRSQEEAILRNMEERGLLGSGEELQARLASAQGTGESLFMAGTQAAADQQQRRDAATGRAGELGGDIRGADFGEEFAVTGALEQADKYRSGEELAGYRGNIGAGREGVFTDAGAANKAAWDNWARTNATSDANVELANKVLAGNVGASERYWGGIRPGAVGMGIGGDRYVGETARWGAERPSKTEKIAGAVKGGVEGVSTATGWFDEDDD